MLLGTVRRKLTALVAFSALATLAMLPTMSWIMHRQLIDEVDDRVPDAVRGFDEELGDDVKDLDVTARTLAELSQTATALAGRDATELARLAQPFHDAYPDIDIVFYDADNRLVASIGCANPRASLPPPLHATAGNAHSILGHGCEAAADAPAAVAVLRPIGTAGTALVCLPLDAPYFANAQAKLGVELALVDGTAIQFASARFPRERIDDATLDGNLIDDGGRSWAIARFSPRPLAGVPAYDAELSFTAALDVSDIQTIVRRHLLISLAIVGTASAIAMLLGWRLAARMSRALSRVSAGLRRLARQEYVKVEVIRTGDELEDLATGFNTMVDGLRERDKLRATMGKYMTAQVMSHVLAGDVELGGKLLAVTILFCDLRDFTTLSERKTAHEVVELLNEYFTAMVEVIADEGGVVDKYIGDNIMAVFGAPVSRPDDAVRAIRAAVRMRHALAALNARFAERGAAQLRFGIGLHTGEVVAGNIGSPSRMEYTVIGDAVNLASRLESSTKERGVDILISEETYRGAAAQVDAEAIGEIQVKGREQPVTVYKIHGMAAGAAAA